MGFELGPGFKSWPGHLAAVKIKDKSFTLGVLFLICTVRVMPHLTGEVWSLDHQALRSCHCSP